jgi:hypothetical protein
LQNDGVWAVRADAPLTPRQGNADPRKGELFRQRALVASEYRCGVCGFDVRAVLETIPARESSSSWDGMPSPVRLFEAPEG